MASAPQLRQDRKTRRGQVEIEARIDLHDMTLNAAYPALKRAVKKAAKSQKEVLLVITGKGVRLEGKIRGAFPAWIQSPDIKPYISGYAPAHIRHGGSGAWYVFIRC